MHTASVTLYFLKRWNNKSKPEMRQNNFARFNNFVAQKTKPKTKNFEHAQNYFVTLLELFCLFARIIMYIDGIII